ISPFNGDMLPLIEMSLREFWANHRYPDHFYEVAHWEIPLTYFPGVWLPFTAPWRLGIDIRFRHPVCYLVMTAMLVGYSLRRIHGARGAMEIVFAVPPALVGLYLFYVPTFRGFLPALHLLPFWLFTVCWGIYFMERRWFVSGIFLGLCV